MKTENLSEKEKMELTLYPSLCPFCSSSDVVPTFDYEHDIINFECQSCGEEYNSGDFVPCDDCGDYIHISQAHYSESDKKYHCTNENN